MNEFEFVYECYEQCKLQNAVREEGVSHCVMICDGGAELLCNTKVYVWLTFLFIILLNERDKCPLFLKCCMQVFDAVESVKLIIIQI